MNLEDRINPHENNDWSLLDENLINNNEDSFLTDQENQGHDAQSDYYNNEKLGICVLCHILIPHFIDDLK